MFFCHDGGNSFRAKRRESVGTATSKAKRFFFDQHMNTPNSIIRSICLCTAEKDLDSSELVEGGPVLIVLAPSRKIRISEPDWSYHVMRILIVEDEPIIALNTEADLETAGHTVVGLAVTSDEAITLADRCRPDLVLMDIRLAKGNGVEAAEAIHNRWAIPSLFATSYVEHSGATCRAALGCLRKPYNQQSLVQSIQIVEQSMNGLQPTLSSPRNLELYQQNMTPVGPVA
jgi:two-component system, response regulator PdtaR